MSSVRKAAIFLQHTRGETVSFRIVAPVVPYDGTETVTCDVKHAVNGDTIPSEDEPTLLSVTPVFDLDGDEDGPSYVFTISAAQSLTLGVCSFITLARVELTDGTVEFTAPTVISLGPRVTTS